MPTARIYALAFAADLPANFPLFWDSAPYTYADYRPETGDLGVSGGRYGQPGGEHSDARYHARLADGARRWLPELASDEPSHAWAVDLAVAKDMIPRLSEIGAAATAWPSRDWARWACCRASSSVSAREPQWRIQPETA